MAGNSSEFTARIRSIQRLSDCDLSRELDQLDTQKRELDAELLVYLSELERRGLHREQSCSSLFEFCVTRLGCSEDVAYKRVGAARLSRQFPLILELLANGRIHLTGLMLLKPHLTEANHREWLAAAGGKSRRQIEKLIASRLPQPDARTSVRKLPKADPASVLTSDSSDQASRSASPSSAAPPRIAPLSSHSYRVVFTASERLKQKLERAGELLSHAIPPKDLPAVIERALDLLIEREEKRRYALHARTEASKHSDRARVAEIAPAKQPVTELRDSCAPKRSEFEGTRVEMQSRESPGSESSRGVATERGSQDCESSRGAATERESLGSDTHLPCQKHTESHTESQDPDPNPGIKRIPFAANTRGSHTPPTRMSPVFLTQSRCFADRPQLR